jgi:hypothetical protein
MKVSGGVVDVVDIQIAGVHVTYTREGYLMKGPPHKDPHSDPS